MTKLRKETPADISALLGDSVAVKKYRNQTVLTKVTTPKKSKSKKKKAAIDRFKEANDWAKSILKDPGMKELYSKGINRKKSNAHTVALCDYLHSPEIHYIRMNGYTGAVGEEVRIKATDDFQVTAVEVSIVSGKGKVLEKGGAVRYGRKPAIWVYTTTVTNPHAKGTVVKAKAEDRPGNEARLEVEA